MVQPDCEEFLMAKDNNRALWDYRIKHLLRARPDSSPEAKNKLENATIPLMNSLFGSTFREWNADKGSDCKSSKWLMQPLIKIFSFLVSSLLPLFSFCFPFFFWVRKQQVFLQSALPFLTSIFTKTNWLFLRSYAPLIIPWKDLKDIQWSCLPTGIQKKQQEFGQRKFYPMLNNFTQNLFPLKNPVTLVSLGTGAAAAQLFHRCFVAAYAAFQVSPTHPIGIMGCRVGTSSVWLMSLVSSTGFWTAALLWSQICILLLINLFRASRTVEVPNCKLEASRICLIWYFPIVLAAQFTL